MILKPTVLILGAGASLPHGYPLGGELVKQIVNQTNPSGGLLAKVLHSRAGLGGLRERLDRSGTSSIDDFLEANPGFQDLGKLCIAGVLTIGGPGPTNQPPPNQDWCRYLWGRLHQGAETPSAFERNRLRVITYNYETSFERYLSGFLRNLYPDLGEPEEAASNFLRRVVPVIHLHGTLGGADAMVLQPGVARDGFHDFRFLESAARGIKIVHEGELSAEYKTAHDWLEEAEIVHFLGFGYHPTNVRRLDVVTHAGKKSRSVHLRGSAYGMEQAEIDRAERELQMGQGILHPKTCLDYLRSEAVLE